MKKGIKILCGVLVAVFLVMLLLPYAFNASVERVIRKESSSLFKAGIDFKDLRLSFLRDFPNVSVSMNDPLIVGKGEFEGDTLLSAKKISLSFGIGNLFGDRFYRFSKISLERGSLHFIENKEGYWNWDILRKRVGSSVDKNNYPDRLKRSLRSVSLKNTDLFYENDSSEIYLSARKSNFIFRGNLLARNSSLKLELKSDSVNLRKRKIQYLNGIHLDSRWNIKADFKKNRFLIADNQTNLNSLQLNFEGGIYYMKGGKWWVDLRLNRRENQFKDLLSLVPPIYAKDFNDISADGNVFLNAFVKGIYSRGNVPAFDSRLRVSNASFQYESMSRSVDHINIDAAISNSGGSMDNTKIDVSKFHMNMAGTPLDIKLHVYNPLSDPYIDVAVLGKLYLNRVKEVYPMENNSKLTGLFKADFKINTRLSSIREKHFNKVVSSGTMSMNNFLYEAGNKKRINIKTASVVFAPQYVALSDFSAVSGKSDISAQGKLYNLFSYLFDKGTIRGDLNFSSDYFDLDDFKTEIKYPDNENEDGGGKVDRFDIPSNLNLSLNANLSKLEIGDMEVNGLTGLFYMNNKKMTFQDVKMGALGGTVNMSGYYSDSVPGNLPEFYANLKMENVSFAKTYSSFASVRKIAPIFKNLGGKFSSSFSLSSKLKDGMVADINSMRADGSVTSTDVSATNLPLFSVIASTLNNDSFKHLKIINLNLPFNITEGAVETTGFLINFDKGVSLSIRGFTDKDSELNYLARLSSLSNLSLGLFPNMNFEIGGSFNHPKISVEKANNGKPSGSMTSRVVNP